MSDSTAPSEGNTDVSGENTGGFKPVTSQEDLDRIRLIPADAGLTPYSVRWHTCRPAHPR